MSKFVWIDVIGNGALLAWLALSIYFGLTGNADMFQRMGAGGVAFTVAYFAFVRHSSPAPYGYHESRYLGFKNQDLFSRTMSVALSNITIIASVLKQENEVKGEAVHPSIAILASGLDHAANVAQKDKEFTLDDAEETFRVQMGEAQSADKLISSTRRHSDAAQMFVVVIATLQWGFGDLLVNFVQCGAGTC